MAAKKTAAKKTAKKTAAKKTAAKKTAAKKTAAKKKAAKSAKKVSPIPAQYHAVTPYLTSNDAAGTIAWCVKAFGAKEVSRMPGPDGKIMHSEIKIGDSIVMIADESPEQGNRSAKSMGGSPIGLMIYTKDVDAMFARAAENGATVTMPVADQFWGDRYGQLVDPFGFKWSIATHLKDMSKKQMSDAAAAFFAQFAQGGPPPAAESSAAE